MASQMYEKFDKYWREYSMVMSFGVILDPRYKFDFVRFALKNLYGDDIGIRIANEIYVKFVELFKHYKSKFPPNQGSASTSTFSESYPTSRPRRSTLDAFDASYGAAGRDDETEFEYYFRDDKVPRKEKLDVLGYWSRKVNMFPVLSSMARDILAIPITSVASESSFSMGGRILNKWRSSLLSKNVEALVTTRNWLFGYEELDEIGVVVDDTNSDDEEIA
ncbi:zinc finger BED domain-containing protein RICESLEEPER 2-like [Silene latifolia]|uniref:zinc finger BED domain-containing protein RICESLEEPER 2-like n=1 Tax=Silene latifolia TaxID=37657 RepID=UPI003D778904